MESHLTSPPLSNRPDTGESVSPRLDDLLEDASDHLQLQMLLINLRCLKLR